MVVPTCLIVDEMTKLSGVNAFELILLAAQRAGRIARGEVPPQTYYKQHKSTVSAILDICGHVISVEELKIDVMKSLRQECGLGSNTEISEEAFVAISSFCLDTSAHGGDLATEGDFNFSEFSSAEGSF